MASLLVEVAGLHKIKKLTVAISWIEIMLLIFFDISLLKNEGINIQSEILSSWSLFIFSGHFLLALFILAAVFIIYQFMLPFLFPLFIFKAFEIVYMATEITWFLVGAIFRMIISLFTWTWRPIKFIALYDTEKFCALCGYIKIDINNIIRHGKRWESFKQIASDMHGDNEMYEFFIRLTSFFSVFSLLLFFFHVPHTYQIISLLISFFFMMIAFQFYKIFMELGEIDNIINKAIP